MLPVERSGEDIFAYTMSAIYGGNKMALVLLNFSDQGRRFSGKGYECWIKLTGGNAVTSVREGVELKAYEGVAFCNW